MTTVNAVASSSKRPAPTTTPSSEPTSAKRPRPSNASESVNGDEDEDEGEGDRSGTTTLGENGEPLDMDEEARAKVARKEARTIRNRESAQRSRNQRKAHLAYLEARVVELEAENRTLRGDAPASAFSPSLPGSTLGSPSAREASPAQSVISLANDLGIPTELVSGTGVKLSSVAPPPADLHLEDIKPVIPSTPEPENAELKSLAHTVAPSTPLTVASGPITSTDRFQAENAALRERVSLLENLVKQVVAVANLSGLNDKHSASASNTVVEHQPEMVSPTTTNHIDWAAFLSLPHLNPTAVPSAPGLEATLSPPYYPATLADAPETHAAAQSTLPTDQTPVSSSTVEATSNPAWIGPAAGEGEYLDVIFGGSNGAAGQVSAFGSGSNKASIGGEISGSVGQATRMDHHNNNVNVTQAFEGLFGQSQQMDWEGIGAGQVQAQAEDWDEAMRSLIEDIEGGNQRQEEAGQRSDVLGMDWFGTSEVRV
ncbi:hypothetical protein IAT40_004655 [Kwoniella sp. CBS 6097]